MNLPASTVLHLSDLHFSTPEQATLWLTQLAEDLREQRVTRLDALILSGDIANRSTPEEYAAARTFVETLRTEFHLTPAQTILVPGNHDLHWPTAEAAYQLRKRKDLPSPPLDGTFIAHGPDVVEVRDDTLYPRRFEHFARFYEDLRSEPYPLDPADQGLLYHLPALGILVLGLNSAWELDHHFRDRASIPKQALSRAFNHIRSTPDLDACPLKIAVWHHPIHSALEDRIKDGAFLQQLAKAGFRLALHGHIHKSDCNLFRYDQTADGRRIDLVCAGTFGAPVHEWVPGYPLQYSLLRFEGHTLTVETRKREEPDGAWSADARWLQGAGKDPAPRYHVDLSSS